MFFVNCFVHNTTKDWIKKEYRDETNGLWISLGNPWLVLVGAWIFKVVFF